MIDAIPNNLAEETYVYNSNNEVTMIVDKYNQELIVLSDKLVLEVCDEDYGDGKCKVYKFNGKSFVIHNPKIGVSKEEVIGYK